MSEANAGKMCSNEVLSFITAYHDPGSMPFGLTTSTKRSSGSLVARSFDRTPTSGRSSAPRSSMPRIHGRRVDEDSACERVG